MFNKLKNKKGMTLVEVVVAFAIISIVSVVIVIGFRTMGGVLHEGSSVSRLDQQLEKDIATSSGTAIKTEASLDVENASGEAIELKGQVKEYTVTDENGDKQTFRIFEAD